MVGKVDGGEALHTQQCSIPVPPWLIPDPRPLTPSCCSGGAGKCRQLREHIPCLLHVLGRHPLCWELSQGLGSTCLGRCTPPCLSPSSAFPPVSICNSTAVLKGGYVGWGGGMGFRGCQNTSSATGPFSLRPFLPMIPINSRSRVD